MTKASAYIHSIDMNVKAIIEAYNDIVTIGRCAANDEQMSLSETGAVLDRIRLVEITDFARNLRERIYK